MDKHYAERDALEMDIAGGYYGRHVSAMTREQLCSKSAIAAELGYRDQQIDLLQQECTALAANQCIHGSLQGDRSGNQYCQVDVLQADPPGLLAGKTPEQQLAAHDLLERYLEDRLSRVRESRRELINRHNLNKGLGHE